MECCFSKTDNRLICFPQASLITDYSVPMGTRIVGDSAFETCKTRNSITIPDSVIKIGKSAFSDCHLRSITLPGSVTVIDDNAFSGNFDLKHIEIPKGVKKIGDAAFSWCIMLEDVNIPDSVETMGDETDQVLSLFVLIKALRTQLSAFVDIFKVICHCRKWFYGRPEQQQCLRAGKIKL